MRSGTELSQFLRILHPTLLNCSVSCFKVFLFVVFKVCLNSKQFYKLFEKFPCRSDLLHPY